MTWDPEKYHQFADHRLRPAVDLIARIPLESPAAIVDLGCGPGNVTRLLGQRWPDAAVLGIDSSAEMLEKARQVDDGIRWQQQSIAAWQPDTGPDLVFSNAALHWLDDHQTLFPRLISFLSVNACLAVQMPISRHQPSHRLMRETLAEISDEYPACVESGFANPAAAALVHPASFYFDLLQPLTGELDIWETEYLHVLSGDDAVYHWVSSTGLRPYLHALGGSARSDFIDLYRRRLNEAYPKRTDGSTLYPFRRLFMVARCS